MLRNIIVDWSGTLVDDLTPNVRGAVAVGMVGVHHVDPEQTVAELTRELEPKGRQPADGLSLKQMQQELAFECLFDEERIRCDERIR